MRARNVIGFPATSHPSSLKRAWRCGLSNGVRLERDSFCPSVRRVVLQRTTFQHAGVRGALPLWAAVPEDGMFHASRLGPFDLQTRQVVEGGIEAQTWQTRENLKSTLVLAGTGLVDVVKINNFLTGMTTFTAMNRIDRECFECEPPARMTVGTIGLANPAMQIEIEAISLAPVS